MASDTPSARESEEQSIKARKQQLFQPEPKPEGDAPRKSFREYLRDTPAASLSRSVKISLWVAGVLTLLLFLSSLIT